MAGPLIKFYALYSTQPANPQRIEINFDNYQEPSFTLWKMPGLAEAEIRINPLGQVSSYVAKNLRSAKAGLEFFTDKDLYAYLKSFVALAKRGHVFTIAEDSSKMGFLRVAQDLTPYNSTITVSTDLHGDDLLNAGFSAGDYIAIINPLLRVWQISKITGISSHIPFWRYEFTIDPPLLFEVKASDCYVTHANYFPYAVVKDPSRVNVYENHFKTYTFEIEFVEVAPAWIEKETISISLVQAWTSQTGVLNPYI